MTLSKKHFEKIAEIFRGVREDNKKIRDLENKEETAENTSGLIEDRLINYFKSENPFFDEVKFREAVLK